METAQATQEYLTKKDEQAEKQAYTDGFERGLKAASLICTCPLPNIPNLCAVKSNPEISAIINTIMANRDPRNSDIAPIQHPIIDVPRYDEVIDTINAVDGNRDRELGRINGEGVWITVMGHVPTKYDDDIDFSGRCRIKIGEYNAYAYCLGAIEFTGTGILVADDNRLFAYSVPLAIADPWHHMRNNIGAELFLGPAREITMKLLPNMEVESIDGE